MSDLYEMATLEKSDGGGPNTIEYLHDSIGSPKPTGKGKLNTVGIMGGGTS